MWVKICGLTSVENALEVSACGVDAIGLNFYKKSKRYVAPDVAREIVSALPDHVEPIGLFVNHSLAEIEDIIEITGIKTVQLHGDETAEYAARLKGLNIIRAFRVDEQNISELQTEITDFAHHNVELFGCLIDAKATGHYGGTGEMAPWKLIEKHYDFESWPRLILAGGLTPQNIQAAVESLRPWGIDTASGVESAPGIKDCQLVREFIAGAKSITED